jgi:hypothetical protein
MAKPMIVDEVQVLRFFESGPIEKAEVVFNIVSEKMRERLRGRAPDGGESPQRASSRKRNAGTNTEPHREESESSPKI